MTLHKIYLLLLSLTLIIGLASCAQNTTEYPFLESFVINTLVDDHNENTVCTTYDHHFDNAVEATCTSFYTEVVALRTLIGNPSNIQYDVDYEQQSNDIVKASITITENDTSYKMTIRFKDSN
jgi:hypothetical protein